MAESEIVGMQAVRCPVCGRFLAEGRFECLTFKCVRCKSRFIVTFTGGSLQYKLIATHPTEAAMR